MPYPVTFKADYVEKRSRLTTFFRLLLAIPHLIVLYVLRARRGRAWSSSRGSRCSSRGAIRRGCTTSSAGSLRYSTRVYGYAAACSPTSTRRSRASAATPYPVDLNIAPPKSEYSRLKVLFRLILAIPVLIIHYAMQIVAQVGAVIAWFAIVVARPPAEGPAGHDRAGH